MGNLFTMPSAADGAAETLSSMDDFDFSLLIAAVAAAKTQHEEMESAFKELVEAVEREEHNRRRRKEAHGTGDGYNKRPTFPSWAEIRDETTAAIFRKKYRMTKPQFTQLCSKINTAVGDKDFRPDATNKSDSYLSGEMRVAIGLRMLCGGSYIDYVGRAYGVNSVRTVYNCFDKLIDWLEATFEFPLIHLLQQLKAGNEEAVKKLKEMSDDFAVDSTGCFIGCIGAIDGIAIRIKCPSNVADPGNYFCRKNFYAINVQAICDKQKRFTWLSFHQGSAHDSFAWSQTKLSDLLEEIEPILKKYGFYFVGDSAYPLCVYLLVPYDDADAASQNDAFNFWLSNSRIRIECAFGELIMRFGIFWRSLRFRSLDKCNRVIRAAALLHNFLIDSREDQLDYYYFKNLSTNDVIAAEASMLSPNDGDDDDDDDFTFPLVVDNNEPKPCGRKSTATLTREEEGGILRDHLCVTLYSEGMYRRLTHRMKTNALGNVYCE
ncbi:hypothetical protein ACHAWC_003355 [Mediolabrus comicus]